MSNFRVLTAHQILAIHYSFTNEMLPKQFILNQRIIWAIQANRNQPGYVQQVVNQNGKRLYQNSWDSGRVTTETSRAINADGHRNLQNLQNQRGNIDLDVVAQLPRVNINNSDIDSEDSRQGSDESSSSDVRISFKLANLQF